jgi:FkbM family methyltransferase
MASATYSRYLGPTFFAVLIILSVTLMPWTLQGSTMTKCVEASLQRQSLSPSPTVYSAVPADFRLGKGPRIGQVCSHSSFLYRIRNLAFVPQTIIDAGANQGEWSRCAWEAFGSNFPQVLMLEGSAACEPALLNSGFEFVISVLGADTRPVEYYANGMSTGNSVLRESTSHFTNVVPTKTIMRTVDSVIQQWPDSGTRLGPTLLKLDVQGYEIEVLRGAKTLLESVEILILEASLVPWNTGAPLMAELISFVNSLGFDVLDLIETHSVKGINFQLDFAFVRKNSYFMNATAAQVGVI